MTAIDTRQNRFLFWPLLLIGIGVVWLLTNVGVFSSANLNVLFRLWPLLLVVVGVNLLLGRRSPQMSTLIGVGGVVLIVALMLVGPSLGWASGAEVKTSTFDEPLADTQTAQVVISTGVADTNLSALSDSANLFEANVNYTGVLDYNVSGGTEKVVTLTQRNETALNFDLFQFGTIMTSDDLHWDVNLSEAVPVDLEVNMGVGNGFFDLTGIQLTNLAVSGGVGDLDVKLPASGDAYEARLSAGTGGMRIAVEDDAAIRFDIQGGVGDIILDLPEGAAVRIEASTGVGNIDVPSDFERVGGNDEHFVGDSGAWETADFDEALRHITISFNGGVGSLIIQ